MPGLARAAGERLIASTERLRVAEPVNEFETGEAVLFATLFVLGILGSGIFFCLRADRRKLSQCYSASEVASTNYKRLPQRVAAPVTRKSDVWFGPADLMAWFGIGGESKES